MEVAQKKIKNQKSKIKMSFRLLFPLFFLLFFSGKVYAESPYVLPYPSSMPGSIFYKLDKVQEVVEKYWYFGDFGQFKYNLKMADKYLVEAKVLFEYKQYLLGLNALRQSDSYFSKIRPSLNNAKKRGKKIGEKMETLKDAAGKHEEELVKLEKELPENFLWSPEKSSSVPLPLKKSIKESVRIRGAM